MAARLPRNFAGGHFRAMKHFFGKFVAFLLLILCLQAAAHDVSVMKLRFQELPDHRYQLRYIAPPGSAESEAPPVLPERGAWEQEPGIAGGLVTLTFTTVDGGALTEDERINLPWRRDGVLVESFWRSGETARRFFPAGANGIEIRIGNMRAGAGSFTESAKRFLLLGMDHFLSGWDHLLFVVCLLMLARGWRKLLPALAAFVAAHSSTLALTAVGRPPLPDGFAGAMVALSIAFLAAGIVRGGEKHIILAAFLFGLPQGIGLGEAVHSLGLPAAELPVAIGFFNAGVEIGLAVLVLPILAAGWEWRRLRPAGGRSLTPAAAYAIGTLAMFWFIERTVGLFV